MAMIPAIKPIDIVLRRSAITEVLVYIFFFNVIYPPSQKTMGLHMDECTKSYGVISPRNMGG